MIKTIYRFLLRRTSNQFRIGFLHYRATGRWPNLSNPRTLNEKLCWAKVHSEATPKYRGLFPVISDKIAVRKYVADRIGSRLLTELYATGNCYEDLKLDSISKPFVIKANHGSTFVKVVNCFASSDKADIKRETERWLNTEWGCFAGEWWYQYIPRQLLVEELLQDANGDCPNDYKFFVINGSVKLIQVDMDRSTNHCRNLYSKDWELILSTLQYPNGPSINQPKRLDEMIEIAEILAKDLPFVRVDLYECPDRVVFGELTICPGSGWERFSDTTVDEWLGQFYELSLYV